MKLIAKIILVSLLLSIFLQFNIKKKKEDISQKKTNDIIKKFEEVNLANEFKTLEYTFLIKDIFDLTYISIILLYFHTSPLLLFVYSLLIRIAIISINTWLSNAYFKIIPIDYYQTIGIVLYFLAAFITLFKLMTREICYNIKKLPKHYESITNDLYINNFNSNKNKGIVLIKVIGIGLILIPLILKYGGTQPILEPMSFAFNSHQITKFCLEFVSSVIYIGSALIIGFLFSERFSEETNLFGSSIAFLILGVDLAVKLFSY